MLITLLMPPKVTQYSRNGHNRCAGQYKVREGNKEIHFVVQQSWSGGGKYYYKIYLAVGISRGQPLETDVLETNIESRLIAHFANQ
jgi:hypothetical protein